ncbi:MAG: NUDIX hydrolase [Chloroflexi bacterium]|nr:NUDIX hydrolase [Chloroflexota bacterium]
MRSKADVKVPDIDPADFPNLFRPIHWAWGPIDAQFELIDGGLDESLISNVRIAAFSGKFAVAIRHSNGDWDHPGGALEPGESYMAAAERELGEEAGAELRRFTPFGVFKCRSERVSPYRPHSPHPYFYQLVGFSEVEINYRPTNPPEAENIAEVRLVDVSALRDLFASRAGDDGQVWAEMYELADLIRSRS